MSTHWMSDNSSGLAMYEMYMTELQSTSHFFTFEMESNEKIVIPTSSTEHRPPTTEHRTSNAQHLLTHHARKNFYRTTLQ